MKPPTTSDPFWQTGYELLPPCLTDDELLDALDAIDEWMRDIASVDFQFIRDISKDRRFTKLVQNPVVNARLTELLGSSPKIYYSHFIVSKPMYSKKAFAEDWHIDNDLDNYCIKTAFYLTDVSEKGYGNTHIQPGSLGYLSNPGFHSLPILTKPGGVLLYRPRMWHSRSMNTSNIVRKVVFLSCQRSI